MPDPLSRIKIYQEISSGNFYCAISGTMKYTEKAAEHSGSDIFKKHDYERGVAMKKLIFLAALLFIFSFGSVAFADSIMCDKDMVNSGDTTAVVEYNCGKPLEKNTTGIADRKRGYRHGVNEIEKTTETWTYIIDERFRYFEFIGGKLETITDGPIAK